MQKLQTKFIDMLQGLGKGSRKKLRTNYKAWIKKQSCLISDTIPVDPHHLKNINKLDGLGMKPSDDYCIPLSRELHSELHSMPVADFEKKYNVDLLEELRKYHSRFLQIVLEKSRL